MAQTIKGHESLLTEVFGKDYEYCIPAYQRPYAWTQDQATELFTDLYDCYQRGEQAPKNPEPYFLGSIVLIKKETEPPAEVVDGQQRLTTLTILFSAMLSRLKQSEDKYKDDIDSFSNDYIMGPGKGVFEREKIPRLILRDRDQPFFRYYIQEFRLSDLRDRDDKSLDNEAQLNIKNNACYFDEKLSDRFNDGECLKKFCKFIMENCFLIVVSTPDQQSAFRVFSVMNSRGLDLQPTDIIKADMIGTIEESGQGKYSEQWEDWEGSLGRDKFNGLFEYIRMIYTKKKAKRTLLEEFQEHVINEVGGAEEFMDKVLEPYAEALAVINEAEYKASSHADEVNKFLRWLNRIDNADWIPVAIFFMAKHKNAPEDVRMFFQKLERLAACLHVLRKDVNARIARYGQVIAALEGGESSVDAVNLSSEEIKDMKEALAGDVYPSSSNAARRLRYLIHRLDSFVADGSASYDTKTFTIEHVLPQTVSQTTNSQWLQWWPDENKRKEWTHKLANLVPLNKRLNSAAGNYNFKDKKEKYFAGPENVSSYALTSQVLSKDTWKLKDLEERQENLMKILIEGWNLKTPNEPE